MERRESAYTDGGDLAVCCWTFFGFPDCEEEEGEKVEDIGQGCVYPVLVGWLLFANVVEFGD